MKVIIRLIFISLLVNEIHALEINGQLDHGWLNSLRMPVIEIEIHGRKLKFLVDTGAPTTIIFKRKSIVNSFEEVTPFSLEANIINATVRNVRINGNNIKDLEIHLPSDSNTDSFQLFDGILGMNFLRNYLVIIDYKNGTYAFKEEIDLSLRPENFLKIIAGVPAIETSTHAFLLLDTGSSFSGISYYLDTMDERKRMSFLPRTTLSSGDKYQTIDEIIVEKNFKIANETWETFPVRTVKLPEQKQNWYSWMKKFDGIIDSAYFFNSVISLDMRANHFSIKRVDEVRAEEIHDLKVILGADIYAKKVVTLYANSPFSNAGIEVGDVIENFSEFELIVKTLRESPSGMVNVLINRNGLKKTLKVKIGYAWWN